MTKQSGVATIILMVTRMGIVTSRWKSQENSRMTEINDVVIILIAMVIRTRNITHRNVAVNVRIILLLMAKNSENMKPWL